MTNDELVLLNAIYDSENHVAGFVNDDYRMALLRNLAAPENEFIVEIKAGPARQEFGDDFHVVMVTSRGCQYIENNQ